MRSRTALTFILCSAFAAAAAPAFAIDALDFTTSRQKSMGGRHVAMADDFSVLLTNPAGLADMPNTFSAAELGVQASGPVFDIADLIVNGVTDQASILDFLSRNNYKIYAGLDVSGPVALGFTGSGLGFGLFNRLKFVVNMSSINSIGISAAEDILLTGGYAHRFDLGGGHQFSAGFVAKSFARGDISQNYGMLEALSMIDDLSSMVTDLISSDFTLTTGVGCDLGLRYDWREKVAVGLVFRDAYSPAMATTYSDIQSLFSDYVGSKVGESAHETLPSSLDFGFMWSPDLGVIGQAVDSFVLALDYKDILDLFEPVPRNPILNASIGLEARVLEIVSLRAGISDALPSAGIGLDLTAFAVNLAVFGTELGIEPGQRTCYNLLVDFDFKY